MKKWQLYLLVVVVILVIGLIFGWKIASVLGLLGGGLAKKEADKVKEKQKDLQKQADNIQKKSDKRKEKADKLTAEGEDREEEAEKINDKLKDTDDSFKNMFNVFLILFLSFSLLFTVQGLAIAAEEPELNPDNFKRPDTLAEANKMIDKLLDFALTYRDAAYQYKNLYEEEKADKEEFKSLYKAERGDNQQLQTIIDNQKTLNDKLQEIIDRLLNSSGGFGFYGGINYKPFKPVESGIEGGITFDF